MLQQTELSFSHLPLSGEDEKLHTIIFEDRIISYTLYRTRRKTIALSIDRRGLRIGAPLLASMVEIETMIRQNSQWISGKLDEWRSRHQQGRLHVTDGMQIPFLGCALKVRLALGKNQVFWNEQCSPVLTLLLRSPNQARSFLEKALREKAMHLFIERTAYYASLMEIDNVPRLFLSSAKTRWGSCSRSSGIRLNWRLVHFPLEIIDYVVVHELAHLREMDHSQRFWRIVEQIFPEYRSYRNGLRKLAAQCPNW